MSEPTKEDLINKLEGLLRQRSFAPSSDAIDKLHDAIVQTSVDLAKFASTSSSIMDAPTEVTTPNMQRFWNTANGIVTSAPDTAAASVVEPISQPQPEQQVQPELLFESNERGND